MLVRKRKVLERKKLVDGDEDGLPVEGRSELYLGSRIFCWGRKKVSMVDSA